jgi:hypothetical protein
MVPVADKQAVSHNQALLTSLYHLLKSAQICFTTAMENGQCTEIRVHWEGFPETIFSVKPEHNLYPKVLQLPAPKIREPVTTLNNKVITKVYSRRRFKTKRTAKTAIANSIFVEPLSDYQPIDKQHVSTKRQLTPVTDSNLRRSKRRASINDGFKPQSPIYGKRKAPAKKPTMSSNGKAQFFVIPQIEFPDLAIIDKCVTKRLAYPHIPIHELQKVATQACGILAEEVAAHGRHGDGAWQR